MEDKLKYDGPGSEATEFRGDFSFAKQKRRDWLKYEFEKLDPKEKEALYKEMGLTKFNGCHCCD